MNINNFNLGGGRDKKRGYYWWKHWLLILILNGECDGSFCPVAPESQNNLIWWWSVRLFMFRRDITTSHWLPGQLTVSAVRDWVFSCFVFFFLSFLHTWTPLSVLRQLGHLFSEGEKSNLLASYQPWLNFRVEILRERKKEKYFLRNHLCINMGVYWLYVHVTNLLKADSIRTSVHSSLQLQSLTSPSYLR